MVTRAYMHKTYSSLHLPNLPDSPNSPNSCNTCQTGLSRVWRVPATWLGKCWWVWRVGATRLGKCWLIWRVRPTQLGECQRVWWVTKSTRNVPQTRPRVLATFAKFALAKFAVEWPLLSFFTTMLSNKVTLFKYSVIFKVTLSLIRYIFVKHLQISIYIYYI